MNPWMWLLWAVAAAIILFVLTGVAAGVWEAIRKPKRCPRCGYQAGTDVGSFREPS